MTLASVLATLALVMHQPAQQDWKTFLSQLPTSTGQVLDYRGRPVGNQGKHYAIINYDVGNRDLQQCADALMRIRSEYLLKEGRSSEIGFHFTDGKLYRFSEYCAGIRPVSKGSGLIMKKTATAVEADHAALRKYLDIIYMYAGTISLQKELKTAASIQPGTVIIQGGSPGHCSMVVNMREQNGKKQYMLVEGYMPAQSIYILRNPDASVNTPWYELQAGKTIITSSFVFDNYDLKKFE